MTQFLWPDHLIVILNWVSIGMTLFSTSSCLIAWFISLPCTNVHSESHSAAHGAVLSRVGSPLIPITLMRHGTTRHCTLTRARAIYIFGTILFVSSLLKRRNENSINDETLTVRPVSDEATLVVYILTSWGECTERTFLLYGYPRGLNRYKLELQTNHRRRFHTRLLLGPSPGLKQLPALSHLKHYQDAMS